MKFFFIYYVNDLIKFYQNITIILLYEKYLNFSQNMNNESLV